MDWGEWSSRSQFKQSYGVVEVYIKRRGPVASIPFHSMSLERFLKIPSIVRVDNSGSFKASGQ